MTIHIDPVLVFLVVVMAGTWTWAGIEICRITHKQRGIEVDRPVTDVLPLPPPPVIVPDDDPVPDVIPDWMETDDEHLGIH